MVLFVCVGLSKWIDLKPSYKQFAKLMGLSVAQQA